MSVKSAIVLQRKGFEYLKKDPETNLFLFHNINYNNMVGYENVKFITTDGQVFFGEKDASDLHSSNKRNSMMFYHQKDK